MHLLELVIKDLRSITSARIEWNVPRTGIGRYPNVNVLLGNNGAGKSTVLRAVALASLSPVLADSGFRPDSLVRRLRASGSATGRNTRRARSAVPQFGFAHAKIGLDAQDRAASAPIGSVIELEGRVARKGELESFRWYGRKTKATRAIEAAYYSESDASFFIAGYGATRRVEPSLNVDQSARLRVRARRYERVAGLFEEHVSLVPLSFWLPQYRSRNPGRHNQVIGLINALLPDDCRLVSNPVQTSAGPEYEFEMNGVRVPFRALSDGYRAYLGWIADMLFHVCMTAPSGRKLVDNCGVVLVDEIDLHLHPEWQRTVLPLLSTTLPNVQFIVTTHSPLVVGSLEARNLYVLAQHDASGATVEQRPERVHGASAEQILLSPYFGLRTTRTDAATRELDALIEQATTRSDPDAAIEVLRRMTRG